MTGLPQTKSQPPRRTIEPLLTSRQIQVLQLLAEDLKAYEIGTVLDISSRTVNVHCTDIHKALGTKTAAGAVVEALRKGLISV